MILSEAFKQLDMLTEETFSIDKDGLEELKDFEEKDEVIETEDIIDPNAESEEELEDSYVGKVILDCCVCHSKLYKDAEEVVLSEDETIANEDEECPFCYSTDGYKVIGQVSAFEEKSEGDFEDEEEKEVESNEEKSDEDELAEGFFNKKSKHTTSTSTTPDKVRVGNIIKRTNGRQDKVKKIEKTNDGFNFIFKDGNMDVGANATVELCETLENTSESYKDTHMMMGGDGSEIYSDIDLEKIWNENHTTDPSMKEYKSFEEWKRDTISNMEELDESKSIRESIENLSLDTDDTHMEMTSEENGKVTITTEPLNNASEQSEFIAPLEDETRQEIETNSDEELGSEEEVSTDIEEFDEESFNELGESYLKKVYDNVESFKTTSVGATPKKLVVEGLIKFSSGKSKKTSFIFESKTITKSGKVKFIGENKEITPRKNAFVVKGQLKGTKLLSESLTYNYRAKDNEGKSSRLYGTVKVGK